MDKKTIAIKNTIIAKFMGWKIDNSFPDKGRVWRLNNIVELDTTFKFHKSWDALIPVIWALMKRESHYYGLFQWFDTYGVCGIEEAWEAVIREINLINVFSIQNK